MSARDRAYEVNATHLQPLQAVLEPPHALLADSGADAARFEEDGLPPTPLRDLLALLRIGVLCQCGRRRQDRSFGL